MNLGYTSNPGATTMTYNGASMTEIGSQQAASASWMDSYYATAPATGAHNIVITTTNNQTNGFYAHCASYDGVVQSSPVEGSSQSVSANTGNKSITTGTITTTDWAVAFLGSDLGRAYTAGAGTTQRTTDAQGGVYDSNAAAGATTYTLNMTITSGTEASELTAFGIKPFVAAASTAATPPLTKVNWID